ncbi:MAG: hypothetical protein ACREXT_00570, partial [Gammaproteobacteria bacterium]
MVRLKTRAVLAITALLVAATSVVVAAEPPEPVDPSTYGMDRATGRFIHPDSAPSTTYSGPNPVKGSLEYL